MRAARGPARGWGWRRGRGRGRGGRRGPRGAGPQPLTLELTLSRPPPIHCPGERQPWGGGRWGVGRAPPTWNSGSDPRLPSLRDAGESGVPGRSVEGHGHKSTRRASSIAAGVRAVRGSVGAYRVASPGRLPPSLSRCEWPRRLRVLFQNVCMCVWRGPRGLVWHCCSKLSPEMGL